MAQQQRTKEEWDAAGAAAETELNALLEKAKDSKAPAGRLEGMLAVIDLHREHFMNAGHKRLGRTYVRISKEYADNE